MKILVLGANGQVGSRVTRELIAHGHSVVAGIHKTQDRVPHEATIVAVDTLDESSLAAALEGVDAVVCAVSSWKTPGHNVLSQTMTTLIPAMEKTQVKRIVSISGDIVLLPNEEPALMVSILRKLLFGVASKVVGDSENHLHQLYNSSLDWTVLRPTTMTSSHNKNYRLLTRHPRSLLVPRLAVVASIVDLIEDNTHIHETPFITQA